MAMYDMITDEQLDLLGSVEMFFVASVAPDLSLGRVGEGPVNISPKGGKLLVLDRNTVAYLDHRGSGNETARHATTEGPVTVMAMSYTDDPAIVRLYGSATATSIEDCAFIDQIPDQNVALPERQVITVAVTSTQTSCGYGVPTHEFVASRTSDQRGRRFK
jgi:hypothetical protein